jgi:pyruvate formate lyase activating enzyme
MAIPNAINNELAGIITNIQRFSVHDGPGIRDLIFVKGCPLKCLWCSNPETQNCHQEIAFIQDRCIGHKDCGWCLESCPVDAIHKSEDGKIELKFDLCSNCGECVEVCPSKAIRLFGNRMTLDEVVNVIEEDIGFYQRSRGGVTVSGGEPLYQADFVCELLRLCQQHAIHTAIETTGCGRWEDLEKVCPFVNIVFYDIKHMDPKKHKDFTGVDNDLILKNLVKLSQSYPDIPITARTPLIPTYNDSKENIEATAKFLMEIKSVTEYELLPYHSFGEPKYKQLGREYPLSRLNKISKETVGELEEIAQKVKSGRKWA